ncbi:MAG: hypothetical protein ACQSGP_29505, partial [Frankia sp.]
MSKSLDEAVYAFTGMRLPGVVPSKMWPLADDLDRLGDTVLNQLSPELAQIVRAVQTSVHGQAGRRFTAQTLPFAISDPKLLPEAGMLLKAAGTLLRGQALQADLNRKQGFVMFIFMQIQLAIAMIEAAFGDEADAAARIIETRAFIQRVLSLATAKMAAKITGMQMLFMPGSSIVAQAWQIVAGKRGGMDVGEIGHMVEYGLAAAASSLFALPGMKPGIAKLDELLKLAGAAKGVDNPLAGMSVSTVASMIIETGGGIFASGVVDGSWGVSSSVDDVISGSVEGSTEHAAHLLGKGFRGGGGPQPVDPAVTQLLENLKLGGLGPGPGDSGPNLNLAGGPTSGQNDGGPSPTATPPTGGLGSDQPSASPLDGPPDMTTSLLKPDLNSESGSDTSDSSSIFSRSSEGSTDTSMTELDPQPAADPAGPNLGLDSPAPGLTEFNTSAPQDLNGSVNVPPRASDLRRPDQPVADIPPLDVQQPETPAVNTPSTATGAHSGQPSAIDHSSPASVASTPSALTPNAAVPNAAAPNVPVPNAPDGQVGLPPSGPPGADAASPPFAPQPAAGHLHAPEGAVAPSASPPDAYSLSAVDQVAPPLAPAPGVAPNPVSSGSPVIPVDNVMPPTAPGQFPSHQQTAGSHFDGVAPGPLDTGPPPPDLGGRSAAGGSTFVQPGPIPTRAGDAGSSGPALGSWAVPQTDAAPGNVIVPSPAPPIPADSPIPPTPAAVPAPPAAAVAPHSSTAGTNSASPDPVPPGPGDRPTPTPPPTAEGVPAHPGTADEILPISRDEVIVPVAQTEPGSGLVPGPDGEFVGLGVVDSRGARDVWARYEAARVELDQALFAYARARPSGEVGSVSVDPVVVAAAGRVNAAVDARAGALAELAGLGFDGGAVRAPGGIADGSAADDGVSVIRIGVDESRLGNWWGGLGNPAAVEAAWRDFVVARRIADAAGFDSSAHFESAGRAMVVAAEDGLTPFGLSTDMRAELEAATVWDVVPGGGRLLGGAPFDVRAAGFGGERVFPDGNYLVLEPVGGLGQVGRRGRVMAPGAVPGQEGRELFAGAVDYPDNDSVRITGNDGVYREYRDGVDGWEAGRPLTGPAGSPEVLAERFRSGSDPVLAVLLGGNAVPVARRNSADGGFVLTEVGGAGRSWEYGPDFRLRPSAAPAARAVYRAAWLELEEALAGYARVRPWEAVGSASVNPVVVAAAG